MEKAVYIILILCGILSQGICHVSVSEGNNETSSNLLIRQKRVVGGDERLFASSPYILHVIEDGNYHCPATILTPDAAISSAVCFLYWQTRNLAILSRAAGGGQQFHYIVGVNFFNPHFSPEHPTVGNLAIVRFAQPINFRATGYAAVPIYSGNVATDHYTIRIISWANPRVVGNRRIPSDRFITFSVILFNHQYCQGLYPNMIGNENMCAIGSTAGQYLDTDTDTGVPLVKGNKLVGIFVYRCNSCHTRPNVFMSLIDEGIRHWIHQILPSLRLF